MGRREEGGGRREERVGRKGGGVIFSGLNRTIASYGIITAGATSLVGQILTGPLFRRILCYCRGITIAYTLQIASLSLSKA